MIAEYALRDSSINFEYSFSFEDKDPIASGPAPGSYEEYVEKVEKEHNTQLWESLEDLYGVE